MDGLRQMLVEPACLHFSLPRAWLSALLTPQIHIFLIEVFSLDKYDGVYIVFIVEYILFQEFRNL